MPGRGKQSPHSKTNAPRIMDGYIRVSRVNGRGGENFISPDVQREKIAGYASVRNIEIAEWHIDLDESGGKLQRPGLDEALARIKTRATGGLMVAKLDRFARTQEAISVIREITDHGGKFISVEDGLDPTTDMGQAMMGVILIFAEMELGRLRSSWEEAQRKAIERGVYISQQIPFGYRKGADGRLKVDQTQAKWVRQIFKMAAAGRSMADIAKELERQDVRSPTGQPLWMRNTLRAITQNPVYLGESRYGTDPVTGGPKFSNANAHKAIVDKETFDAASKPLANTWVRADDVAPMDPPLLTGLLRCRSCRNTLKPDSVKLYNGERVRQYRCRKKYSNGVCPEPVAILGDQVEEVIEKRFFEVVGNVRAKAHRRTPELEALSLEVQEAEADLIAFRDSPKILATLGEAKFIEGLEVRNARYQEALSALLRARRESAADIPDIADLRQMWPEMDVMEKRALLRTVFDGVVVRKPLSREAGTDLRERLHFLMAGDLEPADWPRRGHALPMRAFVFPDED